MANSNTQGFGLIAAGTLGSTPATSGTGKYFIDANYATTIYSGGQVSSAAGYVTEGQQTADNPTLLPQQDTLSKDKVLTHLYWGY